MGPIVVVGDTSIHRSLLTDVLEADDYCVVSAAHGRAARALLQYTAVLPVLVIIDWTLARTDVTAFCCALRADARLAHVPVLVCGVERDRSQVPVDDRTVFLRTPYRLHALVETVYELTCQHRAARIDPASCRRAYARALERE